MEPNAILKLTENFFSVRGCQEFLIKLFAAYCHGEA